MWHIQATLDDQPLADDDKILLENGINVGFSCTFENGLCSGWLSSKERVTGFEITNYWNFIHPARGSVSAKKLPKKVLR